MKKHLLLFFLLCLTSTAGFCQLVLTDHSQWLIEGNMNRYFKKNKVEITKTDTNLIYLLRDSTLRPMDIYCSFDKKKNCVFQKISFDCEICYHKFVKEILDCKKFEWQLIEPNHYLAKYAAHLLLVTDDKHLYYTITLTNYSKLEYKQFINKNKPEVYY